MSTIEPINKAYCFKTASGDYVYIGDSELPEFHPIFKLNRWVEECWFKASFDDSKFKGMCSCKLEDNKVKWETKDFDFHFYPSETSELGGLEFEVIFKKKPLINKIVLVFESDGLKFYYQPPLTQQEIDEGCVRPENVVGSYAVYHATRTNMHRSKEDAEKYKAGKAFHIYRPLAKDSAGNTTWCDLHIDEAKEVLTVTIPQEFLDNAVYPVRVDPTFGYTTIGESRTPLLNGDFRGTIWTAPSDMGTADSVTIYAEGYIVLSDFYFVNGIYEVFLEGDDSPPENFVLVDQTVEYFKDASGAAWHTLDFTTPPSLTAETRYFICSYYSGDQYGNANWMYYDSTSGEGISNGRRCWDTPYDGTLPSTWNVQSRSYMYYSIYCTYTPTGWTGKISGVTDPAKVLRVNVANIKKVLGVE